MVNAIPEKAVLKSYVRGISFDAIRIANQRVKQVIDEYKPRYASKEEYVAFMDSLSSSGDRIEYSDSKIVKVNIK